MENAHELMYMSRMGDEWSQRALFRLFEPMQRAAVNSVIARYRPLEIYRDDLIQEAMVILYRAADLYREDRFCSFKTFLNLLTERKIYSLLRHYSAESFVQMHDTMYLDEYVNESGNIYDVLPGTKDLSDPVYHLRYHAAKEQLAKTLARMKHKEKEVLAAYLSGKSYQEACADLSISYKTYDGRLQRVRKKIKEAVLMSDYAD